MSILYRVWNFIWDGLSHFFTDDVIPALRDWAEQFKDGAGQVVLQDAAQYGPLVLAGTMTILEAWEKLEQDLLAKGLSVSKEVGLNAIRTWTNSAAMAMQAPAAPEAPPVPEAAPAA